MIDLQINLLGPPEIRWKQQFININRRIPRTLLFYLASQGDFVGRGKLLTIFWEDSSPNVARRRLREALSRIRAEIPNQNILTIHNDLVKLDSAKSHVDHRRFLDLQDSIGNQPWTIPAKESLPEATLNSMLHAANLWRGSQFMEGAELPSSRLLDDWWQNTNFRLTHLRTRLFSRICDHYRACGQLDDALNYAYKALESDNLNEDLHFKVLSLLVYMGNYQEAREYFFSVSKNFSDELDALPSQQLVSIYRQIPRGSLSYLQSPGPDWRIQSSVHTPFVGRESEFKGLQDALESGGGCFVTGESGLGKTRLVQEFCEMFASDRRVFVTHCRPSEMNLPFQPLIDLFRNQISKSDWLNLPKIWIESLTLLLPELSHLIHSPKSVTISTDPNQNRSNLLESIRQVFLEASQKRNLVLFVDDVQWADEASLASISYLIERPPFDKKALIILAWRTDEVNENLNDFRSSNRSYSGLKYLDLDRLHSIEISRLGRYVMGYPLDQELVEQLEDETGGNPFIVLETLLSIKDLEKQSGSTTHGTLPLAKSVYSLILRRTERLSPPAREVAEFAAVQGTEFFPELISVASKQNITIIARAIEELKQRNLIEPIKQKSHITHWRFIHEKIRETILLDTNPVRIRYLHENIARALEITLDSRIGNQAAVLAKHYESAGKVAPALNYWLKASQWARKLFAPAEAQQIFNHADKLIQSSEEFISDELIHDFYAEWTEMAYELQDVQTIREHNSKLLKIGRDRDSQLLIGTALDGLSDACMAENNFEEGLSYTTEAISYLNNTDNTFEKMDTHIHRGVFLYMLGRIDEAIKPFELALTLGQGKDNPQIQKAMANCHNQLALTQTLAGYPISGLEQASLSLKIANNFGHHHTAVTALLASSLANYYLAKFKQSRQDNKEGILLANRIQANRMLGYLYAIQGFLDLASGDLGAAYESSQLVEKIGENYKYVDVRSISFRILGDIFLLLEAPSKACEYFQNGLNLGSRDFWGLDNLIRLGYAQIRDDKIEIGMENLCRGIEIANSTGLGIISIMGNLFLSYAYIYLEEWDLAGQIASSNEKLARSRSLQLVQTMSQINQGISESRIGNKKASIEQLQSTLEMLDEIDYPFIELRTLIRMIKTKKEGSFDASSEIGRVHEILNHIENNAHPEQVIQAARNFRQMLIKFSSP
jgi:predicted ATPase/DNA-binding SARP family transcriptional activator